MDVVVDWKNYSGADPTSEDVQSPDTPSLNNTALAVHRGDLLLSPVIWSNTDRQIVAADSWPVEPEVGPFPPSVSPTTFAKHLYLAIFFLAPTLPWSFVPHPPSSCLLTAPIRT